MRARQDIFSTVVIDGRHYPACRYCSFRLSSFYAGTRPDIHVLKASVDRYLDHIWEKHPDKVDEVYAMFKGK